MPMKRFIFNGVVFANVALLPLVAITFILIDLLLMWGPCLV
jgi:hypothetical protein